MTILDGKTLAQNIKQEIKNEITRLGIKPGLAVILVGDDPASHLYVSLKEKACQEVGINIEVHRYPADTTEQKILEKINKLNARPEISGIIVQLPLPAHLNTDKIINTINPAKDVDGFHPENIKALMEGKPSIIPPTIAGIMKLIESTNTDLKNKKAVIVGKSETFALPLKKLLEDAGATAKFIFYADASALLASREANILIVAAGKPKFITEEMVKEGAIVIDVGTNRINVGTAENPQWKTIGDVDFDEVTPKCSFITPVPGGVGPMTVAMLLLNTLQLCKKSKPK